MDTVVAIVWTLTSTCWISCICWRAELNAQARIIRFLAEPQSASATWRVTKGYARAIGGFHLGAAAAALMFEICGTQSTSIIIGTDFLLLAWCCQAVPASYRLEHGRFTVLDAFLLLPQFGLWLWMHWTMFIAGRA